MKKLLFMLLCTGSLLQGRAQDLYPTLVPYTYSGIEKITNEQPYSVLQTKDSFGDWVNVSKNFWEASAVPGYKKYNGRFNWTENAWKEVYSTTDSFVLNQDNQIITAIEKSIYDYPGFSQKEKYRYTYTYNPDKSINTMKIERAASINSNSYGLDMTMKLFYDQSGRRTHDSSYYQQGYREYKRYQYNQANQVIGEYSVSVSTGDTVARVFYSYEGAHLKTTYSESFDPASDNWELRSADSMEIVNDQIVKRMSYALFVTSEGDVSILPNADEHFTYNTDGTLSGITTRVWRDEAWVDFSKTEMIYADGKPVYALIYAATESGYEESPYRRYLFNFLTGVNEPGQNISISAIYPNPVFSALNINLDKTQNGTYAIFDYTGKSVQSGSFSTQNLELDLREYSNGIYYVSIRSGGRVATQKFIVAR